MNTSLFLVVVLLSSSAHLRLAMAGRCCAGQQYSIRAFTHGLRGDVCQTALHQTKGDANHGRRGRDANNPRYWPLVAMVKDEDAIWVVKAFRKVGIECGGYGTRGTTGFRIKPSHVERAKKILKEDAKLHHYTVRFVN